MSKKMKLLLVLFVFFSMSNQAWSWGGRGHSSICEAASFLVKEEGLKEMIAHKSHVMGFLCNIPDTYWKNISPEISKVGSPAHYVNPQVLGLKPLEVPLDYNKIVANYTGKPNIAKGGTLFYIPTDFGSNWWRADQFFRRASNLKEAFAKAPMPTNLKEEQDEASAFNQAADQFFINIGIMGHFVGDNGQPVHSSADYDGYQAGHGGIHGYYEDAVVSALDYDLISKIVQKGMEFQALAKKNNKKLAPFLLEKSVLEKMRALSAISLSEMPDIFKIDKVLSPSELKEEKGMQIKKPAERQPAAKIAKKFEPLIIRQMGRSASLLAQLWDEAYVNAGKPKLTVYKSYKFPFQPEFVAPDYYTEKNPEKK